VSDEVETANGELTVTDLLAMSTAAVGVCESVTETLKPEVPDVVGVPLITPPELMERPGGRVPEARAQVKGPTPPVEVSVAEYATLMTAAGSAALPMTRGRTGAGGFAAVHDKAKTSASIPVVREGVRFNAVINILVAQNVVPSIHAAPTRSRARGKALKVLRRQPDQQAGMQLRNTMVTEKERSASVIDAKGHAGQSAWDS